MAELHFTADIGYLCQLFVEKYYDQICQTDDEEYKDTYIRPIYDEIAKEDIDYEDVLSDFVQEELQFDGEVFTLNTYVLQSFTQYVIENIIMQRDTYKDVVEKRKKKYRIRNKIKKLEKEGMFYYILDKSTEKVYPSDFGLHFQTILTVLCDIFGKAYVYDKSNWDQLDRYIEDNLILGGIYNNDKCYRMSAKSDKAIQAMIMVQE